MLFRSLTDRDPSAWRLLDIALTILADHGMATSTLAARLAASTRAGPHAILLAGLGAVAGPLHGAASRTVHLLFEDAAAQGADAAIADVMRDNGRVPGIGHFIHRTADPRHEILASLVRKSGLDPQRLDAVAELTRRTQRRVPVAPNIDFSLGPLTFAAGMDEDAGEVIFAIPRTAGSVAHALAEKQEAPLRSRPVGRYTGEAAPSEVRH